MQKAPEAMNSGVPTAAPGSAPAPADAASRPAWLDRLPPEVRDKVLALPPEERRAYLQQLREARGGRAPAGPGQ